MMVENATPAKRARRTRRLVRAALSCFGAACMLMSAPMGAARADTPIPRLKPEPNYDYALVSEQDMALLKQGLRAAREDDWRGVERAQDAVTDSAARKLLLWRRAVGDPTLSFDALDRAVDALVDWPRETQLRAEAEGKISASGLTPGEIVDWFVAHPPVSGQGEIAYADALYDSGARDEAMALVRETWRSQVLPLSVQRAALAKYGSRLDRDDHIARVDYLLWRNQRTAARALLSKLPSAERAAAEARMTLRTRSPGVDRAVNRVPNRLQDDPGLLYERARWRRQSGMTTDALPLVLDIPGEGLPTAGADLVWTERRIHIGRALRDGDTQTAYALAADHGLDRGVDFADGEWLAGWLALQALDDPQRAIAHFQRLEAGVSTPISRSRALYWRGRAEEALGEPAAARLSFDAAGAHATTYYGQLALRRTLGTSAEARLPAEAQIDEAARAAFFQNDLARAVQILADLNERSLFREFSYSLDDTLSEPVEFALLADVARGYGQAGVAVRGAKAGLAQGVIEPSAAYPVLDLPRLPNSAPESALLHALMRQESEFYTRAVSHAGARGLMQLMPGTAREAARSVGQQYQSNWLTGDADYNVTLGSAHLTELLDDFDGSYILAAAAYNAGASRANQWIRDYGDPRDADVDPIDWVESIPFSETRDYVMRVMENMQVYRARMNGGVTPIELDQDLRRGAL